MILPVGVMVSYKIAMITAKTTSYFFPIIIIVYFYFTQILLSFFSVLLMVRDNLWCLPLTLTNWVVGFHEKFLHSPCDGEGEVVLLHYIVVLPRYIYYTNTSGLSLQKYVSYILTWRPINEQSPNNPKCANKTRPSSFLGPSNYKYNIIVLGQA